MQFGSDRDAVSPTIATVLMVAIVVLVSATVFLLVNEFRDQSSEPAPHIALVTDNGASTTKQWKLALQSAVPPRPTEQFIIVIRTPDNGTLVAKPLLQPITPTMDFYWSIDASSGTGAHNDIGAAPGSLGGFHLRLYDTDGDGRLGGGDKLQIWYDGDGDQGHASGPDDTYPSGLYTLEIKHQKSDKYVAYETRNF